MILAGEHVVIFGITGCGKSVLTEKVAQIFRRRIVFDRLHQWPDQAENVCDDLETFTAVYKRVHALPDFTILFQPRAGSAQEALTATTDQILALVYQVERVNCAGLALIFEELWLYAPNNAMPPWFEEMILTGRNYQISIIGNAQRPALVSKSIVSQSRHVFVGQFFESRDQKYFDDCGLNIVKPPEKYQFYWFRPGQPPALVST